MFSYCLDCSKTVSKNPRVIKKIKGRIMSLSKCAMCDSKSFKNNKQPHY